ncbi:MAG: DUF362 domain-containing protein [Acidobacteriota bacterium]
MKSRVVVLETGADRVLDDYARLLEKAEVRSVLPPGEPIILKLNLSWTRYFPACSTQPWQLEGTVRALLQQGHAPRTLFPVENRTVVTDPWKGARNNGWLEVLRKYGLRYTALTEVEWVAHRFKEKLLRIDRLFPEGIFIPKMFIGRNILHLPTLKTHGHSTTTGAVKNAFGGLLREVRHYAHKYIHEVLSDLMVMQRELHPRIFAVMDGTVCGNGAGPRTMHPVVKNLILASADSVAIDAVAARLMGFDPLRIGYLRLCHDRGLGVADPRDIEVEGKQVEGMNFGFEVSRSLVIWGDQMLRLGPLRFIERLALHSPLVVWAPFASNLYHDWLWYPTVGQTRIRKFRRTAWGALSDRYLRPPRAKTRSEAVGAGAS